LVLKLILIFSNKYESSKAEVIELKRNITLWGGIALTVGTMIGFLFPQPVS